MSIAPVPDGHLAYDDRGQGPPVVLLHGGALDRTMWDDQIGPLAVDHRVVAVDARGHGDSSTATQPFRHCDDVAALLDHLDIEEAALVGLSMGGGTAIDTALEHPDRVSALVVCGGGTNEPVFADPWMQDLLTRWQRAEVDQDLGEWIQVFLTIGVIGPYRSADDVDPEVLGRCQDMAVKTVRTHVSGDRATPVPVEGSWHRLPEITEPLLGVVGSLDAPDHHAMVERVAASVSGARLVQVPDAAHMPNMERPAFFNDLVLRFLAQALDS